MELIKRYIILFFIILIPNMLIGGKPGALKVIFLNVGGGNSEIVITPSGHTVLIDGGPPGSFTVIKDFLERYGVKKRIDEIIISNPQEFNIGGMIEVIDKYDVGEIYDPGMPFSLFLYENLLETIMTKQDAYADVKGADADKRVSDILSSKHHYEYFNVNAGKILNWGPDVEAVVLSPRRLYHNTRSDANNNSIVIKLTYGKVSFLFTGDIEKQAELDLISQGTKIRADVMSVPNFGAPYSSTIPFISGVNPKIAVISVDKNNQYGYPSVDVLSRYQKVGANVYRTDLHGTVIVTTDGYDIEVKPEKETAETMIFAMTYKKTKEGDTGNEYVAQPKININKASAEELVSLPGLTVFKSQMIVKYRNQHGDFKSIDDLINVPGINKSIIEKLKDLIW